MSTSRKVIRDWFKAALLPQKTSIGPVSTSRWEIIDESVKNFVTVYLTDGSPELDIGAITYSSDLEIVINQKLGTDDSLDASEDIIKLALTAYNITNPSPFDFYETRYQYDGGSEDVTRTLTLSFSIKH